MTTITSTQYPTTHDEWVTSFREGVPRSEGWVRPIADRIGQVMDLLVARYTPEQVASASDEDLMSAWHGADVEVANERGERSYHRNPADDAEVTAWLRSWANVYGDPEFSGVVKAEDSVEPMSGWATWVKAHIWGEGSFDRYTFDVMAAALRVLAERWATDEASRPTTWREAAAQVRDEQPEAMTHNERLGAFVFYAVLPYVLDRRTPQRITLEDYRDLHEDSVVVDSVWSYGIMPAAREINPDIVDDHQVVLRKVVDAFRYNYGTLPEEFYDTATDAVQSLVTYRPLVVEVGDIKPGAAGLVEHLIGDKQVGAFTRHAIENGVADLVDAWRAGDLGEEENRVDYLRRAIRSYGETRWTGGGRGTLEAVINAALTGKPKPLTAKEWAKRYARLQTQVVYVASRYGEEQSMCSTLDAALKELGLPRTREPEREVVLRHPASGMKVRVMVNTWTDHVSSSAQTRWDEMSAEERAAAIIDAGEPLPQWGQMVIES